MKIFIDNISCICLSELKTSAYERKSEQAYIPHAPTLLKNTAHNDANAGPLAVKYKNLKRGRGTLLQLFVFLFIPSHVHVLQQLSI